MLSMNSSTSWPSTSRKTRHREARQRHAQARAGGLVHLPEGHDGLRDDARLGHLVEQVVALTGALADACEHGVATVLLGDVADQLLDDDGLAHAGAAEEADLAALGERADEVDDLDAGLEHLVRWSGLGTAPPGGSGERVASPGPCRRWPAETSNPP
jgi:hypothetical protein